MWNWHGVSKCEICKQREMSQSVLTSQYHLKCTSWRDDVHHAIANGCVDCEITRVIWIANVKKSHNRLNHEYHADNILL
jgi:hypothetical protein